MAITYYVNTSFSPSNSGSVSGGTTITTTSTSISVNISAYANIGYRFSRWAVSANNATVTGTSSSTGTVTIKSNITSGDVYVTLTAIFVNDDRTFTLVTSSSDRTYSYTFSYSYTSSIDTTHTFTLENVPSRAGCNFLGWSTSPSSNIVSYIPGDDVIVNYSSNKYLYAVWSELPSSVFYVIKDGTLYLSNSRINDETHSISSSEWSSYTQTTTPPWYSNWSTIYNVTILNELQPNSCYSMFYYLKNITSIENFKYLYTKNVTNMYQMFAYCEALEELDVSNNWFDTSNVTTMCHLFYRCRKLNSLNLSNFNTSNVTNVRAMFNCCNTLKTIDISNFDLRKCTDLAYLFANDELMSTEDALLETIYMTSVDTVRITNMQNMFHGLVNLTKIYTGPFFSTSNVTGYNNMFYNIPKIEGGSGTTYDSSKISDKSYAIIDRGSSAPGYFTMVKPLEHNALRYNDYITYNFNFNNTQANLVLLNGYPVWDITKKITDWLTPYSAGPISEGSLVASITDDNQKDPSRNVNCSWYLFSPQETATYNLTSTGSSDTFVQIYDTKLSRLAYNDDGGSNTNFSLNYEFSSGSKYLIAVSFFGSSSRGDISFTFSKVTS